MSLLLALDLGTTSVRALAVDAEGRVLARAQSDLSIDFPGPKRVEQDPREMWEKSLLVLREALRALGAEASTVAGVGVVTQRATTIAWDAQSGEPLCPALGWQDQRTAERMAEIAGDGVAMSALPSAPKLEWWLRHEPAVQGAARENRLRFGTPDTWLTWKLTGGEAWVTDPGQASCTALYDLLEGDWNDAMAAFFGIERDWLPRVVATDAIVGETPRDLLGAPVPVAARAGDQQAASFAQGVRAPGDAKLTLGTAAMLDVHTGSERRTDVPGSFPLALWRLDDEPDVLCVEASVLTAGASVDWLVSLFGLDGPAALDALAAEVDGPEGVVFVPALQGLGAPFLDADARGLVGGLTRGTTRAHVAAALLDGIAQRCADACDAVGLGDGPLRVDGGLSRSDLLLQRLADLTGRRVLRAAETETTALGAALFAGHAVGVRPAAVPESEEALDTREPSIDGAAREVARSRWRFVLERARA